MLRRKLVLHVVGARPNYMKIAPVYAALERRGVVEQRLVHTGQHYDADVNEAILAELTLPRPHVELAVRSGRHGEQTARALAGLEDVFVRMEPDLVVVSGDVNSTLAAALAAVKLQIPVCHVEAGLRSFDATMPEEHNRRLTDHVSSLLLTHCEDANVNLLAEGIDEACIAFVGNTMIDTLLANVEHARASAAWTEFGLDHRGYLLVTLHRPALVDDTALLRGTMRALGAVARELPVIFPVHPRTQQRLAEIGDVPSGVTVTKPLTYTTFLSLQTGAAGVVTDSGGVQEETTALGIPCFTLRENTERPVTVTNGTNVLLGLEPHRLREIPDRLRSSRPTVVPPLWDGHAGERAAAAIETALSHDMKLAPVLSRAASVAAGR